MLEHPLECFCSYDNVVLSSAANTPWSSSPISLPVPLTNTLYETGLLRGIHHLDACDPSVAPSPLEAGASVEGVAGEGGVSGVGGFPPAKNSYTFLAAHLEGWRRLECSDDSTPWTPFSSLAGLPHGLGVLSVQVTFSRRKNEHLFISATQAAVPRNAPHFVPCGWNFDTCETWIEHEEAALHRPPVPPQNHCPADFAGRHNSLRRGARDHAAVGWDRGRDRQLRWWGYCCCCLCRCGLAVRDEAAGDSSAGTPGLADGGIPGCVCETIR